jgi:hypothetical protein
MFRNPDEAYLFRNGDTYTLKVIEMKNQNVAGSVDTKLLAGPGFIEEYNESINNDKIKVEYSFCISEYLKKNYISEEKKYKILQKILNELVIIRQVLQETKEDISDQEPNPEPSTESPAEEPEINVDGIPF